MTAPQTPPTKRHGGVDRGQVRVPNRLYMEAPGLNSYKARLAALSAVEQARAHMPKISGRGARSIKPLYGDGFFGLTWGDDYVWFQEVGIHPFTMRRLKGKIIPMWLDDPTGKERQKNPKAKTRVTEDGRTQVLIFRKATKPGAPGRIAVRESKQPLTTPGRVAGAVARRNIGVKWRHPGLTPRSFLHRGMVAAAVLNSVPPGPIHATTERWR